jgi:hypothetical protein
VGHERHATTTTLLLLSCCHVFRLREWSVTFKNLWMLKRYRFGLVNMLRLLGYAVCSATLLVSAKAKGIYEPMYHVRIPVSTAAKPTDKLQHHEARQAAPITTTSTDCPNNDGLFYSTSHNYTYQIQCATTYTGEQITTQTALGFTACIAQCASYNHDNSSSTSFCVGVNFNAETDGSEGDCTLFDEVSPVPNQASEEGSIEDAALLIYGPTGQVFATPEMQPSNVVGGILTNSLVFTSQPVAAPSMLSSSLSSSSSSSSSLSLSSYSSVSIQISTAFVTSVTTVISCAPGISNCPANGELTTTSLFTTSVSLTPATQSISISLGGMRPLTTSLSTSSQTAPSSGGSVLVLQATQTSIVPYTEYHVTTVVSCTQEPTTSSCGTSVTTETIEGLRTEISCSPGTCSGVMLATGTLAGMPGIYTGGCIVESF